MEILRSFGAIGRKLRRLILTILIRLNWSAYLMAQAYNAEVAPSKLLITSAIPELFLLTQGLRGSISSMKRSQDIQ